MNTLWPRWCKNTWRESASGTKGGRTRGCYRKPGSPTTPSSILLGGCIRREGVFSYKMMISFQRSSELPIRFPVFLVSLGSPSTATSTNELIRGWRLCTLGFADTTGQERQKKSRMSQRAPSCPPVADVLPLFLLFLLKKKFCLFLILKRLLF